MNALVWIMLATTGLVAYFCYRGWRHGDPLLTAHTAYGVARLESRADSHRERVAGADADRVRCRNCGTTNERPFRFCRRCETPLC